MNCGNRREEIFKGDRDRERFLSTLGEACAKTEWQILGYCLMAIIFIWRSKPRRPIWWRE
jgi:REP element-mobilizing transposase RayT